MSIRTGVWLLLTWLLMSPLGARADDEEKKAKKEEVAEQLSVTEHAVVIRGQRVEYTATAGRLAIKTDAGKPKAQVFFIAYARKGVDAGQRPVSFCFNGGPGSSSVWLHLGMLGPQRIRMPDNATPLRPPYKLQDNPHSLLDLTDLVFIDPVSTGYSRAVEGQDKKQFHGYDEDLSSVAQFIHDYTTRFSRWGSPKFLIGESYGGVRAAGLSGTLQDRYNMELNGIVLVSGVINFQTLRFDSSNDLPYVLFLPTYTATAHYHKALGPDLQQLSVQEAVKQSEEFAIGDYATALLKGATLSEPERKQIAQRVAQLTGLPADYVEGANLRISMSRFGKQLLRERGLTVGRFDGRYTGRDRDTVGERYSYDASGAAIFGPFTATMNDYLRSELKYENDRVYEILTGNVHPWSYRRFENRYVDASETLRQAMTANPFLNVFAACGYYDLATPHFAMQHTLNHLGLHPDQAKNVTVKHYPGGHMMYIHEPSLSQLREDLQAFYTKTLQD